MISTQSHQELNQRRLRGVSAASTRVHGDNKIAKCARFEHPHAVLTVKVVGSSRRAKHTFTSRRFRDSGIRKHY
jgi:hypothetical protein